MKPIYLDYNATTPLMPEVLEAMLPYLVEHFGNPSSGHAFGQRAKEGVERSRSQVAMLLGCEGGEVLFTGGGTEANNLAIRGVVEARGLDRVITSVIEHPAVEQPCRALEALGVEVVRLPVDGRGVVRLEALEQALSKGRALVSVMHANNETGALQPIAGIAQLAHSRGALVHTDAAQSVGKLPTRVDELGVDLLTIAGHKLYAPKGVGALYVRRGTPLSPFARGAGHERGLRPGTENVASIVALGAACELAVQQPPADRLSRLTARLLEGLRAGVVGLELNGPEGAERLPNTLNVSAPGILGRVWLAETPEVAASTGSACHEGQDTPSGVLVAMGLSRERALGAIRLSVGRPTTEVEIETAIAALARAARRS
ncbi:MAG: cysteine desulfurase [Deltaproteobacteria bacterium]|nr:cysteine desulfurase [Deltaproteobacteria bacterium]